MLIPSQCYPNVAAVADGLTGGGEGDARRKNRSSLLWVSLRFVLPSNTLCSRASIGKFQPAAYFCE